MIESSKRMGHQIGNYRLCASRLAVSRRLQLETTSTGNQAELGILPAVRF